MTSTCSVISCAGTEVPWAGLFAAMQDTRKPSPDELEVTGVAADLEHRLSSMFVQDFTLPTVRCIALTVHNCKRMPCAACQCMLAGHVAHSAQT
jgi:uncharacterized protein with NRDE domain